MKLLEKHESNASPAKTLVLFGGSAYRRDEVIRSLMQIPELTIFGALSEEEGMALLATLKQVDLILIGGRYTKRQRTRIKAFVQANYPEIKITEPGIDYPYGNASIFNAVQSLAGMDLKP